MYTDSEIVRIARECKTPDDVMAACQMFRLLILTGLQPASKFLDTVMIKRFTEVTC